MTPHIPEEFSTRLIDWSPFVIMGNTMPPRDPDEDEEDEDEEEEEEEEEENRADEPPVVRASGVGAILRPFGAGIMFTRIGALCLLCSVSH
jgi:hypothetical protein